MWGVWDPGAGSVGPGRGEMGKIVIAFLILMRYIQYPIENAISARNKKQTWQKKLVFRSFFGEDSDQSNPDHDLIVNSRLLPIP
ncbi:hypothetical protein LYNGBM3L_28090 [Moorena producens 3L]|uniref:Uncharacterized protein n=2 Tax=Coleofasciculaceae TaxID=1892251 RepID=F4XP48_9CYAN|nr:hypothetical protein LYNGBM3L_28090 [Moorena producens 3L]